VSGELCTDPFCLGECGLPGVAPFAKSGAVTSRESLDPETIAGISKSFPGYVVNLPDGVAFVMAPAPFCDHSTYTESGEPCCDEFRARWNLAAMWEIVAFEPNPDRVPSLAWQ
jgi:hypothetical protein